MCLNTDSDPTPGRETDYEPKSPAKPPIRSAMARGRQLGHPPEFAGAGRVDGRAVFPWIFRVLLPRHQVHLAARRGVVAAAVTAERRVVVGLNGLPQRVGPTHQFQCGSGGLHPAGCNDYGRRALPNVRRTSRGLRRIHCVPISDPQMVAICSQVSYVGEPREFEFLAVGAGNILFFTGREHLLMGVDHPPLDEGPRGFRFGLPVSIENVDFLNLRQNDSDLASNA